MTLQTYVTQLSVDEQILKSALGSEGTICDADRLKQIASVSLCSLEDSNSAISILGPDDVNDFSIIPFEVN